MQVLYISYSEAIHRQGIANTFRDGFFQTPFKRQLPFTNVVGNSIAILPRLAYGEMETDTRICVPCKLAIGNRVLTSRRLFLDDAVWSRHVSHPCPEEIGVYHSQRTRFDLDEITNDKCMAEFRFYWEGIYPALINLVSRCSYLTR